ncbi:sirohydrochlorin chelatase [Lysinibacillus sp. BW-2-10]|uniref:sirohydrochlorin chelatase n=1 Tax=Lysinibacillus sp. BW-2-10 TaxID=2590030 RepID=UPI00117DDE0A|nr:sirohydrochlorin chelatase [Lysinibacillus sp. BW-2-10]TSI03051.1 sirohydrochlorin chelatase [Lysinibacillus sp. BW-2-10]
MQAVLYVAHGSRVKAGLEEAIEFIKTVKPMIDLPIQEICFLELAEPSILQGVTACVEKGATNIAVIPILLLSANHAKQDIPLEIEKAKTNYPFVSFSIGSPLGIHEKLIDSLHKRVVEADSTIQSEDVEVLLIGRGSSDNSVQHDLQQIADNLKIQYHYANVNICFLYGNGPSFDEVLQQLTVNKSNKRIFMIPYILFTGLLKLGIQKKIVQQGIEKVVLCDCLGYDEHVRDVLIERIKETIAV